MWKLFLVGSSVMCLLLAGCGKSDSSTNSGANDSNGSVPNASDNPVLASAKSVGFEPSKYGGKLLQSRVLVMGQGGDGSYSFKDPTTREYAFSLNSPNVDVSQKIIKAAQVAGDFGTVMLIYKVDPNASTNDAPIGTVVNVQMN